MTTPYCVVIIRPLSITRGDGPKILEDILNKRNVVLRLFRQWDICETTWLTLSQSSEGTDAYFDYEKDKLASFKTAWCCLFTSVDDSDPSDSLIDLFGPHNRKQWLTSHLRSVYSKSPHSGDTVVYIPDKMKMSITAHLLFNNFNEEDV